MKVIGITGGVGSGKSAVLAWMEQEYGACICQMDEVAKQLQKKEQNVSKRSQMNLVMLSLEKTGNWIGKNWVKWYSQVRKIAMPECNRASGSAEMGAEGYC